jgi:biopolymer transport protein ExbD
MAGASLYQDDDDAAISDINVTPFVDVALVLLVIFMVTARLIVARGVDVEKPKSSVGGDLKGTILVSVDREGGIYVQGDRYPDRAAAEVALGVLVKADPSAKAIVAGDARASYGAIFNAVEACKRAGIESIALADDPLQPGALPPPPPPPPPAPSPAPP